MSDRLQHAVFAMLHVGSPERRRGFPNVVRPGRFPVVGILLVQCDFTGEMESEMAQRLGVSVFFGKTLDLGD